MKTENATAPLSTPTPPIDREWTHEESRAWIAARLATLGFHPWPTPELVEHLDDETLVYLFGIVEDRIAEGWLDEAEAMDAWQTTVQFRDVRRREVGACVGRWSANDLPL